jgi:hypothetical protein
MRYREGERELFIDSEVLAPGKGIAIFTSSIDHWDPPHTGEFISSEKKALIITHIKEAMAFKQQPLEIF